MSRHDLIFSAHHCLIDTATVYCIYVSRPSYVYFREWQEECVRAVKHETEVIIYSDVLVPHGGLLIRTWAQVDDVSR